MDFSKGYSASFYCTLVDPETWNDGERFEITGGSISRVHEDIRQNASITVKDIEGLNDVWIRIYMEANQNGGSTKIPLFTGLASSPTSNYLNGVTTYTVNCYSVLKLVSDIILPIGWYIPRGANAVERIVDLLKPLKVPVYISPEIDYSKKIIDTTLVAEEGETNLSMIDAILNTIDWMLQINGDGSINLLPVPYPETDVPVTILSPSYDVIETRFSTSEDWFDCPNVIRITYGSGVIIARDDDPDSIFSTVNRKREIWMSEESPSLIEGESLSDYAKRRLREEQNRTMSISYTRRYLPEINQGDYIRINYNEINGDFYVDSQSITLGPSAQTNETVYMYV